MAHRPALRRFGALCCAALLFFVATAPAQAAMVGNDAVIDRIEVNDQRARLLELVEREAVREQLAAYGVAPEQARERISRMTDAEVARLHARIEELPAGSASVVGAALVVFIVFVVTDVLGATDIFPFIHPIER